MLKRGYCYNQCLLDTTWTRVKDNNTMIGCAKVVSVSTSCSSGSILAWSSLFHDLFNFYIMDTSLMTSMYI